PAVPRVQAPGFKEGAEKGGAEKGGGPAAGGSGWRVGMRWGMGSRQDGERRSAARPVRPRAAVVAGREAGEPPPTLPPPERERGDSREPSGETVRGDHKAWPT